MDDQQRKSPEPADVKDLPPKKMGKDIDENVKGGAEPVGANKGPKPFEPINEGR